MNVLTLPLKEITEENIFFLNSKKNMILIDGIFTKLIYLHEFFSMNGIYISLPISVEHIEINPIIQQKYTIYFSINTHMNLIENIDILEKSILNKYHTYTNNKVPIYSIQSCLRLGFFKIFKESKILQKNTGFALKISGIWENTKNYGLSYKIIDAVHLS
jgi:hypothetical protein